MLLNDLSTKIANHRSAIDAAIQRVLNRSWLIFGPEVESFEKCFAEYVGVKYCRTLANGTDALELALRTLGIKQNDKVATVANAGFYTSTAILAIGAVPFYLDVNVETCVVDINEIERAIRNGVKAIVVTHLFGQAIPDIVEIAARCRIEDIALIEDCAQAHGAMVGGKQVGSFGNIGCFSFYPTKNLGALGDGGAIVTNNPLLSKKVSSLRQYGWSTKYHVEQEGARNSRLDEIQAAILSEFLPYLDAWNTRRRQIAATYTKNIKNSAVILPNIDSESHVAHLYVVRSSQRASLQSHLRGLGIATDIHYPIPDYRQPIINDKFLVSSSFSNTEQLAEEILTLPCYPEMTESDTQQVIIAVNSWLT